VVNVNNMDCFYITHLTSVCNILTNGSFQKDKKNR